MRFPRRVRRHAPGNIGQFYRMFATNAVNDSLKIGPAACRGDGLTERGPIPKSAHRSAIAWGLAIVGTLVVLKSRLHPRPRVAIEGETFRPRSESAREEGYNHGIVVNREPDRIRFACGDWGRQTVLMIYICS